MRIGIIGSHGVGKSTLARHLSNRLCLPLIEEQMRKSIDFFSELGLCALDEVVNSRWYSHYVFDLIKRQIEDEHSNYREFVSDRTVLDYYLYYDVLSKDSTEVKALMKSFVYHHFAVAYDVVFYIPIMFPLTIDGFRNEDIMFRKNMDEVFKREISSIREINHLNSIDLDDRIKEVVNYL